MAILDAYGLTPVEFYGSTGVWMKRDDLFEVAGVCGGKARGAWVLCQGAKGVVTCGARHSPQVNIVAQIARHLGIPCRAHTPTGPLLPELLLARAAGADIVQHRAGYNSVIQRRARDDAEARGWTYVPFGMQSRVAMESTATQVVNLPAGARRLVVTLGSGMSAAGILLGLQRAHRLLPVLGVRVGGEVEDRLDRFLPSVPGSLFRPAEPGWRGRLAIVRCGLRYEDEATDTEYCGVRLDPRYDAKCVPFLKPGDVFWVVGIAASFKRS